MQAQTAARTAQESQHAAAAAQSAARDALFDRRQDAAAQGQRIAALTSQAEAAAQRLADIDRQIRRIEAIFHRAPFGTASGWSTWEQSISSEAQDIRQERPAQPAHPAGSPQAPLTPLGVVSAHPPVSRRPGRAARPQHGVRSWSP